MIKIVVKVTWSKTGQMVLEKAALAESVAGALTKEHEIFTNPSFDLARLAAAGTDLRTKYLARNNGPVAKSEFDEAEHVCETWLYTAADYVNKVANGDVVIINKSTFTPIKNERTPAHVPAQSSVEVVAMKGGTIDLRAAKVEGYDSFIYILAWGTPLPQISVVNHQVNISGSSNFVMMPSAKIHDHASGFAAGTAVTCWCLAQNSAGIGPLSNPVNVIAQI